MRYRNCLPILFAPYSFILLCDGVSRKLTKQAKGDAKAGIFCHGNRKDLKSMRGYNTGHFAGSGD